MSIETEKKWLRKIHAEFKELTSVGLLNSNEWVLARICILTKRLRKYSDNGLINREIILQVREEMNNG